MRNVGKDRPENKLEEYHCLSIDYGDIVKQKLDIR